MQLCKHERAKYSANKISIIVFHNETAWSLIPCQYQHLEDQLILEFHHAYELISELDETLLDYKLFQKPRAVAVGYYPIECVSSTGKKDA